MDVFITLFLVVLGLTLGNTDFRNWLKKTATSTGLYDPRAIIVFGLAVLNLVIRITIPWLWSIIFTKWMVGVALNVGLGVLLYLYTIKTKGADGKEGGSDPTAMRVAKALAWLLILGLGTSAINKWKQEPHKTPQVAPAAVFGQEAPMEVARQIICKNESGCRQYEEGTKIPFKNKGIPEEGVAASTAAGKYQFTQAHWEKAKGLGFDLNTEEGQDKYFEWVWTNDGKTKHWESDPYGSFRWITELMSLGYGPWIVVEGLVRANPGPNFGRKITIHPGVYLEWSTDGGGIEIMNQKGDKAKYDPQNGVINENLPYPSTSISFRSLGDTPVQVKLRFSRTPLVKMSCTSGGATCSPLFCWRV